VTRMEQGQISQIGTGVHQLLFDYCKFSKISIKLIILINLINSDKVKRSGLIYLYQILT